MINSRNLFYEHATTWDIRSRIPFLKWYCTSNHLVGNTHLVSTIISVYAIAWRYMYIVKTSCCFLGCVIRNRHTNKQSKDFGGRFLKQSKIFFNLLVILSMAKTMMVALVTTIVPHIVLKVTKVNSPERTTLYKAQT